MHVLRAYQLNCRYEVKNYHILDCHRGGQPRHKKEVRDPLQRRSAPGSRKCGCTAKMVYRILEAEGEQILEVVFPAAEVSISVP
jgi:hypothetical protein